MSGGSGAGNSSSIVPGGGNDLSKVHGQVRRSESEDNANRRSSQAMGRAEESARDAQRLHALKAKVDSMIANNARLNEYRSQIRTEITHDGLMIQIVDDQNRPMFDSGSAVVKPYMRDILREIGAAMGNAENRISLSGHTDAAPYGNADRGYSNWELSADRANASRRELVACRTSWRAWWAWPAATCCCRGAARGAESPHHDYRADQGGRAPCAGQ
jgi:chemotaxis protein MotB